MALWEATAGQFDILSKMSILSFSVVDTAESGPYNPPTADEAAPQSANEIRETFEIAKKFEISKRVLTG
jgi:hypothetical protein